MNMIEKRAREGGERGGKTEEGEGKEREKEGRKEGDEPSTQ